MIVGLAEGGLRLLQDLQRLLRISFLKPQPALENPHDRRHGLMTKLHGQFPALYRVGERLIVLAFHPQTAALPEIRDRQEFFVIGLFFESQHKIEVRDGLLFGFLGHSDHAFRQPQVQIILQWQAGTDGPRKARDNLLHERRTLEANIHPLREVAREARGILLFGIKYSEKIVVLFETRHPPPDATAYQILLELR